MASFALLALLMMTLEMGFASAHSLGHDAAEGSEIRWEEYTRYEAEYRFGINEWDALDSVPIQRSESNANLEFWVTGLVERACWATGCRGVEQA